MIMILVWTFRILTLILGIVPLILAIPAGLLYVISEGLEDYLYFKDIKDKDRFEKEILENIKEKTKNL
jgi:hypothetical protein